MKRWKNTAGRLALELLFGDLVKWDEREGTVDLTPLARRIQVRPVRLVEYLRELHDLGYLESLTLNYKTIKFKFRKVGHLDMVSDATPMRRWKR